MVELRSIGTFSEGVLEDDRIPVNVGEDTLDSPPAPEGEHTLLSSSSDNVPEERLPALHGGLTDNAVVHVLTDLLLDLERSDCRIFKAR